MPHCFLIEKSPSQWWEQDRDPEANWPLLAAGGCVESRDKSHVQQVRRGRLLGFRPYRGVPAEPCPCGGRGEQCAPGCVRGDGSWPQRMVEGCPQKLTEVLTMMMYQLLTTVSSNKVTAKGKGETESILIDLGPAWWPFLCYPLLQG